MNKAKRKNILIDLSDLKHPNCGFGQIAINYSKRFANLPIEGLHFFYLLPNCCPKIHSKNVTSVLVRNRKIRKWFPFTLPKVDIWHSVNQYNKLYRQSPKFIFTIHDLNFLFEQEGQKRQEFLQRIQQKIDKATIITTISHYVADEIKKYTNLNGKEIRVIYNGVERIDQQEGKQPKFATGRPFFFTIGEIRTKKNFHLLVDVMKFLPEYDLYICGKDSFQYADEIRTQIKEKAVGNVFVTGMIEQTEKYGCIVIAKPSYSPVEVKDSGCRSSKPCNSGKLYLYQTTHVSRKSVTVLLLFGKSWNRKQWQKAFGRTYPYFMNKKKKLTK